jgi:protein involved in polysaccharide export with SLBB domain
MKTLAASAMMLAFTLMGSQGQVTQPPTQPGVEAPVQISVNVLGEVNRPARITLTKGGTLLDAIALAGGLTRIASPTHIVLIHKSAGEKPDSVKIDLRPILAGKTKDILLRDGDTVNIEATLF